MENVRAAIFNPENLADFTKMKKDIKRLKKEGLMLAIVSSMPDYELYGILANHHLHYDRNNNPVFYVEIGLGASGKKESFSTRLKMAICFLNSTSALLDRDIEPEEIIFISSKKENIALAKRFGIKTFT